MKTVDVGAKIDQYMLRVIAFLIGIATVAVLYRLGPAATPVLGVKYGLFSIIVAFGAYLTGFLGMMGYVTSMTRIVQGPLESSGSLARFTHALTEPMHWANLSLLWTLLYYATMQVKDLPQLGLLLLVLSISCVGTTALSIVRNFHILRMFLTTTMRAMMLQLGVKEAIMAQIHERLAAAAEAGEEKCDCPACRTPGVPDDTTVQ